MADVDTLIADLKTGDDCSRASAARALGELGGEKAAQALIAALDDEENWVKEYAAEALGKLAHAPAIVPLGKLLESDNYNVRCYAVNALGKIGGEEARQSIEPLKDDSDSWVREAAISALAKMPAEPARPPVVGKPIPAEIEPELSLSEKPTAPGLSADVAKHSLADQAPRTPEEIVRLIVKGTSTKYKATGSGYLLRVDVGGGRHQRVRLKFDSVDEDGSPTIQIFTMIGPAKEKHYNWALKLNPTFSYGALGIVKIDGKELLAAVDTFLEQNVDIEALKKSIRMLAKKADALEKKLIRKDLW